MGQAISFSGGSGGGGGGAMMLIIIVIAAIAFIWFWRNQQNQQQQPTVPGGTTPQAPWVINTPGSPAAPAAPAATLPPVQTCNCTTNVSCNALCSNITQFNQCCFGTTTTQEDLPDPNPAICSSQFNGSCNTECGRNGDIDECEECNAVCNSNIAYTGPDVEEEEAVPAGAAQPTCPTGYVYSATQNLCILSTTAAPAQPTCPAGYTYDVTHNLCVQTTAAPVYPNTPISPPLSQANPTKCKNTYHGKCDTECSSGSQSVCNDCMIACGTATAGAAQPGGTSGGGGGGRTAECSSKFNGSCNTECSSGNNSTCNACRAACGLSANIATVYSARSARQLLNNRLYNSLKARRYSPRREVSIGYTASRHGQLRIGNLI